MHITFADRQTRDTFENARAASRRLGSSAAKAIQALMADMEAASCLSELPWEAERREGNRFAFVLEYGLVVEIFVQEANDLGAVTAVKIERIGHE